jgi:hypothetical protein
MYIYQNTDWHSFKWNGDKIQKLLLETKKAQGFLLGKMDSLGFDIRNNTLLGSLFKVFLYKRIMVNHYPFHFI